MVKVVASSLRREVIVYYFTEPPQRVGVGQLSSQLCNRRHFIIIDKVSPIK